jgi:hypothetical protein
VSVTVDAHQTNGTMLTLSENYVVRNGVIVSASGSSSLPGRPRNLVVRDAGKP